MVRQRQVTLGDVIALTKIIEKTSISVKLSPSTILIIIIIIFVMMLQNLMMVWLTIQLALDNRLGNKFIGCWFNSIQFQKKIIELICFSKKKIDIESRKVRDKYTSWKVKRFLFGYFIYCFLFPLALIHCTYEPTLVFLIVVTSKAETLQSNTKL